MLVQHGWIGYTSIRVERVERGEKFFCREVRNSWGINRRRRNASVLASGEGRIDV